MDKEKIELYARLYARTFLIAETADNGGENMDVKDFEMLADLCKKMLDRIDYCAWCDLTFDERERYKEITDMPNRVNYE